MVIPNYLWAILILLFSTPYICLVTAIGIDDKLDFGHGRSDSTLSNRHRPTETNRFLPVKYTNNVVKEEKNDKAFANIGMVCVNGGCNLTKPTNVSEETGADVVVHIETTVNLKQNKSKVDVGETPDVPIVVGYKGSRLDGTGLTSPNYKSVYVPESASRLNPAYNTRPNYGPSYTIPKVSSFSPMYAYDRPQQNFRSDSLNNNYPTYDYTNTYNPSIQGNDFSNLGSDMNINIKTLQPVVASGISRASQVNNFDSRSYKDNRAGSVVPYFDPSYHNHHYGEHPPPQFVHYPKKNTNFNPVEFKVVKTSWSPSVFYRVVPQHRHTPTGDSMIGKCSCQNDHPVLGMRWYPSVNRKSINTDPGASIDDKLAPLN